MRMLSIALVAAVTHAGAAAAAPAPSPARPAIAAIVAEFTRHPVVAIAEVHQLRQAAEFYIALAHDPGFQRAVDDIVIEFASVQSQPLLDRYVVAGDSIPADSLATIWRDTSKAASWDSPVYARWLAAIRDVNRSLPRDHRLRVLAGDSRVDWSRMKTQADWSALGSNDASFASIILNDVLAKHHRALVVLGSNHLGRKGSFRDGSENTTTRVEAAAPGSMYVALLWGGWPGGDTTESRIARERWPVPGLCDCSGTWPGDLVLANAGGLSKLGSRADGLLYLGPVASFVTELARRTDLESYDVGELDRRSWIEYGDSARARRFLGLGKVVEYRVNSAAMKASRRIWVYTPPGYDAKGPDCDLLLAFDGGEYLSEIPLHVMLDTLLASKRIRPTVTVFVDDSTGAVRLGDLANQEPFVKFVGDELVPWTRARFNVSHDPHRATITGSSAGGLAAAFVALRRPDLFGNVFSQSGALWRGASGSNDAPFEWLTAQYKASPKVDVRFVLEVGSTETRGAIGGTAPSILDANRRLRDVLRAKGYALTYTEVQGGHHAPDSWGPRVPGGLVSLMGIDRPH